jgi:peptidoglycan/LPS O-acetylase OafA/YrhL
MIKSLTSWRGIIVLSVFLFHFWNYMAFMGLPGMCFFFMISGFFLSWKHPFDELNAATYRSFIFKRLAKFYPLYLLTLVVMVAFMGFKWSFIPDVLLIQSFFPSVSVYFSYNGVAWFLSAIFFCYLCFPFIIRWLRLMSLKRQIILVVALVCVLIVILPLIPYEHWQFCGYVFPLTRLVDFIVGMVLYNVYRKLNGRKFNYGKVKVTIIELSVIALCAIVAPLCLIHGLIHYYRASVLWFLPIALLILVFTVFKDSGGLVTRLLSYRPLYFLGEISYEIYLIEILVGMGLHKAEAVMGLTQVPVAIEIAIGLTILIVLSWLANRYFKCPINKWANGRLARS